MQIYRGKIQLLDYVFYATTERGKVYETGPFIHNYALSYALGLVDSESYTYAHIEQKPQYVEHLTPLNGQIYITPGTPVKLEYRQVQWNTIREGYGFAKKERSIGYPDWGFARVLRPESTFTFYLLCSDNMGNRINANLKNLMAGRPTRIRLGKFLGKAYISLEKAEACQTKEGDFRTASLLNWRDLEDDPTICDVLATSLPTRLIGNAYFANGTYFVAQFGDDKILLPSEMRYLARQPEAKKRKRERA